MEARSGQNCSNKIAPQVSFFSHWFTFYELVVYFHRPYKFFLRWLLIFFSSMNYFNLVWLNFLYILRINFSLVLQIIFDWYCELFITCGTENYFFINADNYFSRYREFIFWPTIHCGLAFEGDWLECFDFLGGHFENCASAIQKNATAKHCQRKKRKRFSSFLTKSERSR